jgi:hypothetical protein
MAISIHVIFDTTLAIINQFPFYTLVLHLTYPDRLPNGIKFETCSSFGLHQSSEIYDKFTSPGLTAQGNRFALAKDFGIVQMMKVMEKIQREIPHKSPIFAGGEEKNSDIAVKEALI